MTITAVYDYFAPEIADLFSEAFEQAGLIPTAIRNEHLDSATRSLQFLLQSEWVALGLKQWEVVHYQQSLSAVTPSVPTFTLPAGAIDIFNATLIRASRASPMYRMSRREWQEIPDKTPIGRPSRYWVDRQYNQAVVTLWQPPSESSDVMDIYYMRNVSQPGNMSKTMELPPHVLDACASGLAARLALKFNPQKYPLLQSIYNGPDPSKIGGKLKMALDEDQERADVKLTISLRR